MAEIQDRLRDPALTRKDFIRLSERAIALAAADALGGDMVGKVAAIASLTRCAQHMHDLWEREARSEGDGADDEPASADELRDELARRLERLRGAEQDRGGS
jgi:hypothetical protein